MFFVLPLTPFHRTLADRDDRGKLNVAEFHVAMGLIYRSMYFSFCLASS